MSADTELGGISRRSILISAAFVPLSAIRSAAQAPATALSPDLLKTLEAFADRLIPQDENGPGAAQCGAANYINLALAGPISAEKDSFTEGLKAVDAFARQSQGAAFADLSAEKKDAVVAAVENGSATGFTPNSRGFFTRIRRLTLEGTFSDPYYGGNKGFAGWDLIGYPGPRLAVGPDEQKMRVAIKPVRMSVWGNNNGH